MDQSRINRYREVEIDLIPPPEEDETGQHNSSNSQDAEQGPAEDIVGETGLISLAPGQILAETGFRLRKPNELLQNARKLDERSMTPPPWLEDALTHCQGSFLPPSTLYFTGVDFNRWRMAWRASQHLQDTDSRGRVPWGNRNPVVARCSNWPEAKYVFDFIPFLTYCRSRSALS